MATPSDNTLIAAGRSRTAVVMFFAIAVLVLAGDLIVKQLAFARVAGTPVIITRENCNRLDLIPPHDAVSLIPNVLSLKLTVNRGAVFGLGAGGRFVFIGVTLVAVAVIMSVFWRSPRGRCVLHAGLALILAGALGNLYDRVVYGVVRDMLYIFPGVKLPFGLTWPGGNPELYPWIFNIADAALCVGVLLIILTMLRKPRA